jgi:hypothetical protein
MSDGDAGSDGALREQLRPLLERFEVDRRAALAKGLTASGATLVAGALVASLLFLLLKGAADFPIFAFFVSLVVAGFVWSKATRDYVGRFKDQVMRRVIQLIDPDLDYQPFGAIAHRDYDESGLFQHRVDRYSGEDLVSGKIGATALRFSEVHSEYKTESTDSKGRRRTTWHTIFRGLFFVADFNKHFKGRTVVLPDSLEGLFGGLAAMLQKMNFGRDQLVSLEDPEFEKAFVVYGTDQVEARYILSNSLMRRILDFRRKMGEEVYLSFVGTNVYVAVKSTRNRFEPRIFRSLLEAEFSGALIEEVRMAVGIVEDLNLNTRIWTKE